MNFINKNNNIYFLLMPFLALTSFLTWIFKLNIVDNIIIYGAIMIMLTLLKQPTSILMLVVLFAIPATYSKELYLLYQILFVYVVIYALVDSIRRDQKMQGALFWPLTISAILSILTLIWTPSFLDGLAEFLVIIQGVVAYFIVINEKSDKSLTISHIAWLATLIQLVVGFQYLILTYEFFPYLETKQPLSNFWANANLVAALLGLLWIPSLYKYVSSKKNKWILLYLPLELISIYAIYMSKSRGLYFGFIIGIIFLILIKLKVSIKKLIKVFMIIIAVFIGAMIFIIVTKDIFPDLFAFVEKISSSRIVIYEIALKTITNPFKLLFGNGLGTGRYNAILNDMSFIYYHSWFFHILATRGLINLLIQIYIIYRVMKLFDTNNNKNILMFVGIIVFLAHSLIDIGYDYQQLGIIYYIIIALVEKENLKAIRLNNMLNLEKLNPEQKEPTTILT